MEYVYNDLDGDIESGTTFIWYRVNNGGNHPTQVGTGITYTTDTNDRNYQLYVEVTPRAATGTYTGIKVISSNISIY